MITQEYLTSKTFTKKSLVYSNGLNAYLNSMICFKPKIVLTFKPCLDPKLHQFAWDDLKG